MLQTEPVSSLTTWIALSRKFEVMRSTLKIKWNSNATLQAEPVIVFTKRITLIRGQFVMACRAIQINRSANAIVQAETVIGLTTGIALIR
jgi:hypothetical protein